MENVLNNEELAKRFLLGKVSETERAEIEDSFLAQDDSYQQLLIAEDDLIDAYVRGELPAPERELFERWLLASQHLRERVEFAQTLFNSVSGKAVPARVPDRPVSWWRSLARAFITRRPALGFAFAAALLVIVLGGLWLLTDRRLSRPSPEQAKAIQPTPVTPRESSTPNAPAEAQQARNEERTPARETPTPTRPAPLIATFTLVPGLVRGENDAGALAVPAGATEVRLRLTLEGERYSKYRATVSTPEGRTVWSIEVTNAPSMKSTYLTASIPADLLKNGDYVLDLSGAKAAGGWESVADYAFRIVKK